MYENYININIIKPEFRPSILSRDASVNFSESILIKIKKKSKKQFLLNKIFIYYTPSIYLNSKNIYYIQIGGRTSGGLIYTIFKSIRVYLEILDQILVQIYLDIKINFSFICRNVLERYYPKVKI